MIKYYKEYFSKIPANDNFDFDKKATKPSEKPKEKKNAGLFGGM